jgi:diacylglycerol kinase family enzyme
MPRVQPRELDSGVLELVVVATWSKINLLRLARRTLQAGLDGVYACSDFPWCTVQYVTELVPPGPYPTWIDAGIDGELVRLNPPLHFSIRARALRVISVRPTAGPDRGAGGRR